MNSMLLDSSKPVVAGSGWRRGRTLFWIGVAVLAAANGYLLHHYGFFSEHELESAILAVGISAGAAVLMVGTIVNRRHPEPPAVVLADQESLELRPAEQSDVEFCATLHARYLSHGFFVALGPAFMRAYYSCFLRSPHGYGEIATAKGYPVGMLVGTVDHAAHMRWMVRQRGLVLGILAAGALATRPLITFRFARTRIANYRRSLRRHRRGADPPVSSQPAVLSHIAVVEGARGEGVGERLVAAFADQARRGGKRSVVLTTMLGEGGAVDFYLSRGWTQTGVVRGSDDQAVATMSRDLA